MKNLDVKTIFKSIIDTIIKFRLTLFIVVMVGGLTVAVLMLNTILQSPASTKSTATTVDNTTFDQATIDRLKQLHTSSSTGDTFSLPTGRINPFSE